jgi:hypothetical protein
MTEAMGEAPPAAATTLDPASIVARVGLGVKLKAAALGLLVLAFVPHAVPLLIVAAVFWALWNRRRTDSQQRSGDVEALRILVNEVRRPRSQSSTDRPLTRLRKLEEQLRSRPRA